jgi:hypothetical protein
MAAAKSTKGRKIGRDAEKGTFISVEEAERRKKTAVVETLPDPKRKPKPKPRKK